MAKLSDVDICGPSESPCSTIPEASLNGHDRPWRVSHNRWVEKCQHRASAFWTLDKPNSVELVMLTQKRWD